MTTNADHPRASLTEREKRMLRLMCDGLTNEQMATRLNLSLQAVRTSIKRMFEKLETGSRNRNAGRSWRSSVHAPSHGRF